MSRTGRLLVLTVAWAVPVVWIGFALLSGPSDGTSLRSSVLASGPRWGESVVVARAYGDTPLVRGDEVLLVEERSLADWVGSDDAARRDVGDVVRYEVRRSRSGLDLIQQVDVTLERYDVAAAVRASPQVLVLAALLLVVGSAVFWVRSGTASARAFLVATALLPAAITSAPFGTGVIDLAGGGGVWPQVVGEVWAALALVALVVSVAALVDSSRRQRAVVVVATLLAPFLAYGIWLGLSYDGTDPSPARLQVLATVAVPALWACIPVGLVVAALTHARARRREDVLATRLVLLGLAAGVGAWILLGQAPAWIGARAPLPDDLLAGLAAGVAIACVGAAAAHYRLGEIEPRVRRGLVQALVLVVVGAAFVGLVRAVDAAADISAGSMLLGGLLALLLVPVAVTVQRTVRRLVYGDRASPDRVVSDLRRLDAVTAPEAALRQVLELLARRLHLSFAAVDVFATPTSGPIAAAIGSPSAAPATIDLAVGGATLGRLQVEVDTGHDPFGPGDRRLLEDIGSQVGALVQAVVSNRELQQSRQRLVSTREEERRRLRRDLHDGLGPSLATLAMRLESATDLIRDDPERAADLVARLSDQAREDIVEVRRLVEGLRPPALDQLGLVSALRHRAAEHASGSGSLGVPWSVEADDDLESLPAAVEVAAYRIVVEAVTNVQRHSGADSCRVRLARADGELLVEVADDGRGLAVDRRAGVGLSSMRERAEELGGTFDVGAGADGGTVVRARLPLVWTS
ncbi:Histidine kinase-, DNA gyrase B-, and HSP90-like ATPase [Nocardioides alpinus]|uniref:Histidine kinase-, DNA gyrase B-, and HSP90-like ATPase n=1 Tax=Nocardioides alpinus TaxID=748909 RepID=A0A1I0XIZ4_9ACTN|nr:sensor histidine kinase [Nocardioides alpinus]PKH44330.1 sensor histidine kinase [Nocardioides alpinus]SFA99933.1 Histidine kinase-, DNA gyrase B-, and HSP90-like ATPase [Nocardioides alpinus]